MSRAISVAVLIAGLMLMASAVGAQEKGKQSAGSASKAAAAEAPAASANPKSAGSAAPAVPWLVNCASVAGQVACEASQRLVVQDTGQLLLSVTVRIPPDSKNGAMMLHLPHGLFLPDGVSLDIDGKGPKKHEVQTCDQKGCYAGLPIDDKYLKELRAGQTMTVAFRNLQKEDVRVPISLGGFEEAYKKLSQ